ncbi:virulence factor TspB C-terminal domain-related protein [Acinetobacter sp. YH12047]|uniref:virulence factor TspB C-terminal domain-related protein n=1 Tax=Acinetobacter sp. YH12047 TaxID=2601053 RepID=UPI0015D17E24|nr:virulence factor TspB C-terminal domain-related protein [Acinetobacter sp. YH12047]
MYNYVDNGWSKTFLKKIISILLIYSLFFTSSANAANVGGWSLSNAVAQGASTVYDATKNVVINGKDFVKDSWVKITPTVSQVSKVLARGGAGYALSVAVEQLIGAVDWVLDPANNRIVYTADYGGTNLELYKPRCLSDIKAATKKYGISSYWAESTYKVERRGSTVVCLTYLYMGDSVYTNIATYPVTGEEETEKSIPLDVVASQVISNAESSSDEQIKVGAQVATTAAAADIVAEAEKDDAKARPIANQAEANAETKPADEAEAEKANEAQGQSKPNEANPEAMDISLEFPVFCNWAPTICEAAQVVISFPNTLTGWYNDTKTKAEDWATSIAEAWTAAKDWAKNEESEEEDNDPPEINTIDIGQLDTGTFKATAGCPAPIQVPVNLGSGGNVEISYEPICQFASKWSFVAPLIGFLSGAMILVGVGRKGEDGEI